MADIRLSGKVSGQPKEYATRIEFPSQSNVNPELERLWAYASIERMTDEMNDFGEDADLKQAITDLSVEYGLVTDYTSMVVVRDEIFESMGIKRQNKKRLEIEAQAQQLRSNQAPASNRVDTSKPMFQFKRPSFSGGGSFGGWLLVLSTLLLGLQFALRRKRLKVFK